MDTITIAAQDCVLLKKTALAAGFYDFVVKAPTLAPLAKPGQFAHILIPGKVLRRPISICQADGVAGTLRFVFQIRGEGTALLAKTREGDTLNLLAPLGNGFPLLETGTKAVLVGGGIGTPPLLGLAEHYGSSAVVALGFRSREAVVLETDFQQTGATLCIATEDGSLGRQGLVTEMIEDVPAQVYYACGPLPMLKAVSRLAYQKGVSCYLSLEERMACGVGACLGCACGLLDDEGNHYYGHVCKDGPVFPHERLAEFQVEGGVTHG